MFVFVDFFFREICWLPDHFHTSSLSCCHQFANSRACILFRLVVSAIGNKYTEKEEDEIVHISCIFAL